MEKPKTLMAKSTKDLKNPSFKGGPETLIGHTKCVLEAAEAILERVLIAGVPPAVEKSRKLFHLLVILAACLHDLGKATNIFQGMLMKNKLLSNRIHPVRHEVLSALLIAILESPLKTWIEEASINHGSNFRWMLSWVAGGHHLKLHEDNTYQRKETERLVRTQGTPREFIFWGSHPDIKALLRMTCETIGIRNEPAELPDIMIPTDDFDDLQAKNLESIVDEYVSVSNEKSAQLSNDEAVCLALAKAVLISADVAGSALPQEVQEPRQWIDKALSQTVSSAELQKIIEDHLKGGCMRPFQERIASSGNQTTLTIAGCGNGKTLAAYAWGKKHAVGKKLFFCYPTTGTASAGYEDYLLAQSDLERALIHGRSHVDMERILETGEDDSSEENQRLESLKAWSRQVVACTVDTVLGLVQNQRRALFSFPALADSAFVFDEIHNYDTKLFGALLRFLGVFPQSPILLMSASIPQNRLTLLRDNLGERLSEPIQGEADIEEMDRYRLRWREKEADCWPEVEKALAIGQKVLWVCNTVGDAMRLFEESSKKNLAVIPIIYHSRFRYKDRVDRQQSVIKKFKKEEPGPVFVIATQVCEMSLNISADLMITALAPFPSLIQRLGRLNRYAKRVPGCDDPPVCDCLIYDFTCHQKKPYAREELDIARRTLKPLWEQPCSQRTLAQALEKLQENEELKTFSAWLDGKWESDQRPLRDGGISLTVVLEEDLPKIREELKAKGAKPNSQNVAAWTIPMWYSPDMNLSARFGGYPVAQDCDIEYNETTGAQWRKNAWRTY